MKLRLALIGIIAVRSALPQAASKPANGGFETKALQAQISALESRLARLEKASTAQSTGGSNLWNYIFDIDNRWVFFVDFDPATTDNYKKLDLKQGGYVFIVLESAEPHLDGISVKLKIGNPSSATYGGFKLNVLWSARWKEDNQAHQTYLDWWGKRRSTTIDRTDSLPPGHWTEIEFTLPDTKPEQFGYISIGVETNKILLTK